MLHRITEDITMRPTKHAARQEPAAETVESIAGEAATFTRRQGLRKAAYIAPAAIALSVAVPAVALGRSGPTGLTNRPANPGSTGKDITTDKSPSQAKGPKK